MTETYLDWPQRLNQPAASPLNCLYMGTPAFAVPSLKALASSKDVNLVGVVSQPDRRAGRGKKMVKPPVAQTAVELGLPLWQPERVRDIREQLEALSVDAIYVAAFGQILPKWLLTAPTYAPFNLHASILPKYRGAAPILAAIRDQEAVTGVTLMGMEPGLDAGPILDIAEISIADEDTTGTLTEKLSIVAADLTLSSIDRLKSGQWEIRYQDEADVSYAAKIEKRDGAVNWATTARQVDHHVRAMSPWPGAFTYWEEKVVKIIAGSVCHDITEGVPGEVIAADHRLVTRCAEAAYEITKLQLPGKKPMTAADFLRGYQIVLGTQFSNELL